MNRIIKFALTLVAVAACTIAVALPATAGEINELNVSFVKAPFNLPIFIARNQGMLENEFAKDGITVKYHEITSGSKQAQALAGGSLDIASVINTTSVMLSAAAGNPIKIIAGFSKPTKMFALVVRDPAIASLQALKGKKIASPKGTVLHQTLLAALQKEGMTVKDIDFIIMQIPQALTALLSGAVDGAMLAASHVIKAEEAGGRVLFTADGLVNPLLVVATSENFLSKHPDIVRRYLAVKERALAYMRENLEEALKIGAEIQGIPLEEARKLFQWTRFISKLTQEDLTGLEDDQAFLVENRMMKKRTDISKILGDTAL